MHCDGNGNRFLVVFGCPTKLAASLSGGFKWQKVETTLAHIPDDASHMMADDSPGRHIPSSPQLSPTGTPDDSPAIEVDFKADSPADSDRSLAPTSGLRAVGHAGEPVVVGSRRGVIDPFLTSSNNLPIELVKLELPLPAESNTPSHGPHLPPSRSDVFNTLSSLGLPSTLHPKPHCSRREDAGGGGLNLNNEANGGRNQVE